MARRKRSHNIVPLVITDPTTGQDYTIQPLDGETQPAYRAFLDYVSMERPGVTYLVHRYQRDQAMIDAHRAREAKENSQRTWGDGAPVQSLPWIPKAPPSTNPSTVWGWYHKFNWTTRSDMYRDIFNRVRRAGMVESLVGGIHSLSLAFQDIMEVASLEARKLLLESTSSEAPSVDIAQIALVAQRLTSILARVSAPENGGLDMSRYQPQARVNEDGMDDQELLEQAWGIMEENIIMSVHGSKPTTYKPDGEDPYDPET